MACSRSCFFLLIDCDDTCRDPPDGLGFCTGILAIGCCNFYQDNTCVVTCPDGYEEVDGMDCGELAIVPDGECRLVFSLF